MGVKFLTNQYEGHGIKTLTVKDCEPFLTVGYVTSEQHILSSPCVEFIEKLREKL